MRASGTLAVVLTPEGVEATLAGPFGSPIARYENGALRGEGLRTIVIEPGQLRALLAGVWKEGTPEVAGVDGTDALLKWRGPTEVEGVLSIPAARFESLKISRPEGTIVATYSGLADGWPRRIDLEDVASRNKMRLVLINTQ